MRNPKQSEGCPSQSAVKGVDNVNTYFLPTSLPRRSSDRALQGLYSAPLTTAIRDRHVSRSEQRTVFSVIGLSKDVRAALRGRCWACRAYEDACSHSEKLCDGTSMIARHRAGGSGSYSQVCSAGHIERNPGDVAVVGIG